MKKLFKIIFGLIGTILLLIIILVVTLVILLYDNTNKMNQDIIDADKSSTEVIQDATYDALETTVSDGTLSFGFTEYSMNELLYSLTKELIEQIPVLEVKGVYAEYNEDGSFTLNAPLKLYSFSSRLSAKISVIDTDESVTLSLDNLKLGKISSTNVLVKSIIEQALDPQIIEDAINDNADLNIDVEYEESKLTFTIMNQDFFNLIETNLESSDDTIGMVSVLIDVAKNNPDLYDISFDQDIKGFVINLSYLESDVDADYSFEQRCNMDKDENSVVSKVEKLLKEKTITEDQLNAVINLLVRGYENLDDNDKAIINSVDLSTIGISESEKSSHKGIVERNDGSLIDYINANIPTLSPSSPNAEIKIYNSQVNAIIDDEAFIGTTAAFTNTELDVNYITIGNVYVKSSIGTINDSDSTEYGKLDAYVIFDLNGKEIQAQLALHTVEPGTNYKLVTYLDSITIGNVVLNQNQSFDLFNNLNTMLGIDGFMTLNQIDKSITLDFTEYFEASNASIADDYGITNTLSIKEDLEGKPYISVEYHL